MTYYPTHCIFPACSNYGQRMIPPGEINPISGQVHAHPTCTGRQIADGTRWNVVKELVKTVQGYATAILNDSRDPGHLSKMWAKIEQARRAARKLPEE